MEPDLLPCPFCGGEAERIDMNDLPEDDPNAGGSCICCKRCGASSPVHFDRKENLCASWNDRVFAAGYVPASEVQTAREEALVAGWEACRRSVYAVCEDARDTALAKMAEFFDTKGVH